MRGFVTVKPEVSNEVSKSSHTITFPTLSPCPSFMSSRALVVLDRGRGGGSRTDVVPQPPRRGARAYMVPLRPPVQAAEVEGVTETSEV